MGWRTRVLLGRLRDQATVLATVTLVTFVATTLLGTFAFLLDVTGDDAVDAALARVPDTAVALEATLRVRNQDTRTVLDAADATLAATLGDVPATRSTWLTGRLWSLPRSGDGSTAPLAYPASTPLVPAQADLVSGTWPEQARDAAGTLLVNVPDEAARRYGWSVGTQVPVRTLGGQATDTWTVVGTHTLTGPPSAWTRDRLGGAAHDAAFPVPGSMGKLVTDAWGPMVVAPDALLGPGVVETAHLVAVPDLADAPRGALAAAREALESGQVRLSDALERVDVSGSVRTELGSTIDAAWRELTVTRVGVVVVGLLLVVLATTVMLLTARLLGERRAAEGELVAARGASPAQLRSLAVVEAALVAGATAAVAPWAARVVFGLLATTGLHAAGLDVPAGVPVTVALACVVVATVLAVALVVPAWHTAGSTSAAPHAGLVRAGADLGLVALAAVALWQLLDYGAPLTRASSLDPVLVAGPALVTLGAAVLALRLVPVVAHGADALARRSRSLVAPLAAWQVARRPATATGTTLVVVLAVAAATFSHALLLTWRTSQLEQVDLAVGADARVDDLRGERLTQSADARAAVGGAPAGVTLRPVADRDAGVGRTLGADRGSTALDARLLAVDTGAPDALRGRSDVPWPALVRDLATTTEGVTGEPVGGGTPLPGDPGWLVATVTPGTQPAASGEAHVMLAVEDDAGVRAWLSVPSLSLSEPTRVAVELPRAGGTVRLVAAQAVVALVEPPQESVLASTARGRLGHVGLALHDARVVDRTAGATTLGEAVAAAAQGTPVDLGGVVWSGTATSDGLARPLTSGGAATVPAPGTLPAGALVLDGELDMTKLTQGTGRLVAHTWDRHGRVRALVTQALAERAGLRPGTAFWVRVGDAQVELQTQAVVPYLPGRPRGPAVLVDRTALGRAVVEAAGTDPLVDSWWLTAPDDAAPALARAVAGATGGTATVRVTQRSAAVAGPLRVAVPAALSLVTAATAALVLVGLGAAAAAAVRSRRLELARLQALGAPRTSLVGGLVGEHALLVALGAGAGLAIGYGLARVVAPVLTVSADGRRPVPTPLLVWEHAATAATTAGLALGACLVVTVLATALVRRASGALLRLGDDA